MKRPTLELICCPACRSALSLNVEQEGRIVDRGELSCLRCERSYPIQNGIVHFIETQELEGSDRRFARSYNRLAPLYSIFTKTAFLLFGGERKARKQILERLEAKGGRTLEVSIGTGDNLPYLFESPDAGEVYGLDISIGQLSRCHSRIDRRGWQVDLFLAAAEKLPFKENIFDSVFHIGGINFFTGKQQAIEEMIRVARPGSKIVIADEAERLANRIDPSLVPASSDKDDTKFASTLAELVPGTMQEIHLDGIWKLHGKYHGYCLEFRKPV